MFERIDARTIEHCQNLPENWALAPWSARINIKVFPARAHRFFIAHTECCQIIEGHPAAFGRMVIGDGTRNITFIKGIMDSIQCGFTAALRCCLFNINQILNGAREIGLNKMITNLHRLVARQKQRCILCKQTVIIGFGANKFSHRRVDGETVTREAQRSCSNIRKTHGAMIAQRCDPRARRSGRHCSQQSRRDATIKLFAKDTDIRFLWPNAQPINGEDLTRLRHPDHDGCNTGKVHNVALHNSQNHAASNTGINRIAACFKD